MTATRDVESMASNQTPKKSVKLLKRSITPLPSISTYAAQCGDCFKWRVIPTADEYEEIRSKIQVEPFVCTKSSGVSCEDPADIEYDSTQTWAIDKPGIPKTPRGFKRSLVLRRDYSKMDAYYITPTGKRLKCHSEIATFLEANPDYRDVVSLKDFSFASPKVLEDTVPESLERRLNNL